MASMSDCSKIRPLLSEYVDGALEGDAAWDVKMHLSSCAVCNRIAEDFTATSRLLGALSREEPSAGFEEALVRRLADQSLRPKPVSLGMRLGMWWSEQTAFRRPAVASLAVAAAVVPLVVVVAGSRLSSPETGGVVAVASPSPVAADPTTAAAASLGDIWDDHTEFSSSLPLGDQANLLTVASEPDL